MRSSITRLARGLAAIAAGLGAAAPAAHADVTMQQQSSFDIAFIKMHGTSTVATTADKRRTDSDMHCEGFMSLLCGNAQSGDIIRLDRDVQWSLDPRKKEYRESHIPTAAERQAAEQQAEAVMEKMKQCPAPKSAAPTPDTSKCEMSQPVLDVKATDQHATIAGHDTRLSQVSLTQTCTNRQNGDVCSFVYSVDSWLAQDAVPGVDDSRAFDAAYLKKLGLDAQDPAMQKQIGQFLAPYRDSLKQLAAKSADLKGYPLKSTMRISIGGEHCSSARGHSGSGGSGNGNVVGEAGQAAGEAAASSSAGAAGSSAGSAASSAVGGGAGGSVLGSAAGAFAGKLVSGMFAKRKAEAAANQNSSSSGSAAAAGSAAPGMAQVALISVETTAINTGSIAPANFDTPAGWTLVTPKPQAERQFTCPNSGG
jgi:hypothetical protein